MALTFSLIKRPCAKELGLSTSDVTRIADALNEVQERLMDEGKFKGTYQKYRFCVNDGCVTLPREVEALEAFAVEGRPGTIRNQWFEFLESGPGIVDSDTCIGVQLVDRGLAVAFDDVIGTGKQLAVYSDKSEATGAKIILQYYDSNGQWVRTQQGGEWADGEALILPAAGNYVYSTYNCAPNGLKHVIKPITNGFIRLYERDTTTGDLRALGYYAPTEQVPEYRRAFIPNLTEMGCDGCENVTVDVMCKLKHVPITGKDNDLMMIRSLGALKLGCKAWKMESANDFQGAAISWGAAVNVLDKQLRAYLGDGAVQPIRAPSSEIWGGGVANVI